MNKRTLVAAVESRHPALPPATVQRVIEDAFDVLIREVAHGGNVVITGLGTFERVDRLPRTGRNPRTGETVSIPATQKPKFRPSPAFVGFCADPSTLPVGRLAGTRRPVAS